VVSRFTLEWEDPLILRRDRSRVLTVQTDPAPQSLQTSADILARVKPQIDALSLPPGYSLEWGGDAENSSEAQQGLFTTLPVGYLVMFIITVLMFSSLKNAVAIWLTVPLALIGVTPGFLITGIPFGFMALIGLLSLSGMLIRNGIVLVEEIELQKTQKPQHEAILYAATSRLRPILLTAFTTVLGLAPLLLDVFFQSMAVVIMFGLGFATILTLLVLPVIYASLHRQALFRILNVVAEGRQTKLHAGGGNVDILFAFSWNRSSSASAASSENPRASRLPVSRQADTQESV
jgi:multidrug efflux pump subunit AcrB